MSDCVFCKIAGGEIPSCRVYEDDTKLAFLDIAPIRPGHTLLVPKKHFEWISHMSAAEAGDLLSALPGLAAAIVEATGVEGYNVFQTNGACSGQVVPHVHFHIIPRQAGDGAGFRWNPGSYAQDEMQAMRERILAAMGN